MLEREDLPKKEVLSHRLSSYCQLIDGAKRAAIYDLKEGNVYSINEAAREIIGGSPDEFSFWEKLAEMKLAENISQGCPLSVEIKFPQVGLEFMWLELTSRCNQRCVHCYADAGNLAVTEELPVVKWEQIIEEGNTLGCRKLQFIGGEPLLFEGIFDLVQTAKNLGYGFIEIFTNGSLLNETKIRRIKDLGINIAVSFYSIVPEAHEAVTQVPGSFRKTFEALKMLQEAEIPTRIGIVVMKQNQDTILETQRKLQEMGFDAGRADVVRPTARGRCADLLPKDEVVQTWALMTKPNFSTGEEQFFRNQRWNSCWAGKIAITSEGGVMPCIFAREHVVAGTKEGLSVAVNSKSLQDLWRMTKDCVEGCRGCEYRYACHDCRPLAEGTTGNLYAKSPRCTYDPLKGEWANPNQERR